MDPEAEKSDTASGGISENEVKLLEALKLLGIKLNVDSPQGMMKLVHAFGVKPDPEPIHIVTHANAEKPGSFQYPRISTFYGEDIKAGEVNYDTFKYEIEA
ncbi:hypothetical protein DPMN_014537 [Dreissena polymorpha]|uniref:Uncharacterized protein n=1 Tax=Dreissena polymorpha TaxID=45954 RepID=A0A9D4N9U3_DREPO|nr:hypothetical protein DPMN_014537 [Dreissena polymorpha]